ncbi:MAG: PAS domain S-box protein [bacterium]|nr:PAS domain S-box protein [bacterium]
MDRFPENYKDIIDTLPDIVYQLDTDGNFTYLNDSIQKFGYTVPELLGKHFSSIIHPDDREKVQSSFVLPRFKGTVTGEGEAPQLFDERRTGKRITTSLKVRLVHKKFAWDRELFYDCEVVAIGYHEIGDDNKKHFFGTIGIIRDISDIKRSERAIVQAEKHYRFILENVHEIVSILANDGTILYKSNSITKNLGYELLDLIGENELDYIHPHEKSVLQSILSQTTKLHELHQHHEYRLRHSSGEWRTYETWISPIIGEKNSLMCFLLNSRDIHDRKNLELELLRSNETLRDEIKSRTIAEQEKDKALEDARTAKEIAESANRVKNIFLSNMNHELRTPLNSILGFTQVLGMEKDSLSGAQQNHVKQIHESGEQLLMMITQLLDIVKIESNKIEIEKKEFNLLAMLLHSPSLVKERADQKQLRIELDIDPSIGILNGDEIRIRQVLYNLLSNAVKFTEPGKRIGVSVQGLEDSVDITVWDEGRGIPEESLCRVFQSFEQVINRKEGKPEGAGVGLYISKRLVELHNGTLSVRSKKNEGSRFSVHLPGRMDSGTIL